MKYFLNSSHKNFIKSYKENDERWRYFFVGIVVSFIAIIAFVNIIQYYFKEKGNLKIDMLAIEYVKTIENNALNSFFKAFTNIGDPVSVIIMTVVVVALLYLKGMKNERTFFALNILGVWLFNEVLKISFKRDRPSIRIISARGYSLPSGHAMVFLTFSIIIVYLILLYIKNKSIKYIISTIFIIMAIFIGLSRVYLRVHYLSDVLAGWSAAMFWSGINIAIHRFSYYRKIIKML
ncbi:undecaprenyl-diphosphatase [Clostridium tetanomorphum]|uniref:Phosphatase PAP2 family protein n=1 Tax=Clostridium tetanomorphum TaxID=1553 RepID=A0A923IZ14_CLOTT|nr:phosphatase PAP2 family protein [Clostridium tetanomorphum]KAJ53131.1 phosphatase [Clostridium tetanomorphum DSM 665]MBC2396926.1 phosphatase PAP2 family protein [Clostridium tetanomorphum]MBP1863107.1 undecaprenyl-diphosphatase [Clostridium tetanomorphum]NRS84216.1 undecaprenyl-diphosphatase [Clostridium tetanomorphum]NRZ97429.1 undecaprenyl-diphosphatase [Clostridium tetanomorphum]